MVWRAFRMWYLKYFIVFSLVFLFLVVGVSAVHVGETSYGYVDEEVYGNPNSDITIVIVTGMHSRENGTHQAIRNKLKNMPVNSRNRYVNYNIHVTKDAQNYDKGRMNGQLLAQKYIVPHIDKYNPLLVLDIHENRGKSSGYEYSRFLYPIQPTSQTYSYTNHIKGELGFLEVYVPPSATSPPYMTIPVASKGIPTIIYENYKEDSPEKKQKDMNLLVNSLEKINLNIPKQENTQISTQQKPNNIQNIQRLHTLTGVQFEEVWNRVIKWKNSHGQWLKYVTIHDHGVGVDKIHKNTYLDMKGRWDNYIKTHNGQKPQKIGIEGPIKKT